MEQLSTVTEKEIGSDGRIKRRYEVEEKAESSKWLNLSKALILGNILLVIKAVFFGSEETATAQKNTKSNQNPEEKPAVAPGEKTLKIPALELIQNPKIEDDWDNFIDGFQSIKFTDQPSKFENALNPPNPSPLFVPLVSSRAGRLNDGNVVQLPTLNLARPETPTASNSAAPASSSPLEPGDDAEEDDESEEDNRDNQENRRPSVSGPVSLGNIYVNQSIVIGLSSLLFGAQDADGDVLSVQNLSASSGSLITSGNDTWTFTPEVFDTSEVTFTFQISDGESAVAQTAELDLLAIPGEEIIGTPEPDRIFGTAGNDRIDAKASDDDVFAREGDDIVYGGEGNDRILGGPGDDVIYAGLGDDIVFAGAGDDTVFGGEGNDFVSGDDGDDVLLGGGGDDTILGGQGDDEASGEDGDDRVDGGSGNDFITGDRGSDHLSGGDGDDIIIGGSDSDIGDGGSGNDLFIAHSADGDDSYDGGDGTDTYDLSGIQTSIDVDLELGTVSSAESGHDEIKNFEAVVTGSGDDTLLGGDGDEVLSGNAGKDDISGGAGNDVIIGGADDDVAEGGSGDDVFVALAQDGDDTFTGGEGTDTYDISDTSASAIIDLANGYAASADIGNDQLAGFEIAVGGAGDDRLIANESENSLTGGLGNDVFVFIEATKSGSGGHMRDRIQDFEVGDTIDVSLMDGDNTQEGLQRLTFLYDQAAFDGVGQILYRYTDDDMGGFTTLRFNVDVDVNDGEYDVDFEIEILGHHEFNDQNLIT